MDKLHVNVDITSDIVCPWCWIGKKRMDSAIERLSSDYIFHLHWKPFLLNPHVPEGGVPLEQYLRNKFGDVSARRFLSGDSPVTQNARAVGINFTPSRLVVPTKKAHILLAHADKKGKQHEFQEVLFRAYFSDGQNISDEGILHNLLTEVGLDGEKAMAALQDTEAVQSYEAEVEEAVRKGITGVPYFEVYLRDSPGKRKTMSGAQPVDTFVALFNRLRLLPKV